MLEVWERQMEQTVVSIDAERLPTWEALEKEVEEKTAGQWKVKEVIEEEVGGMEIVKATLQAVLTKKEKQFGGGSIYYHVIAIDLYPDSASPLTVKEFIWAFILYVSPHEDHIEPVAIACDDQISADETARAVTLYLINELAQLVIDEE